MGPMPRARFHVCHVFPPGRVYFGLNAYRDIADSIVWGLQELGYEATYAQNSVRPDAVNIVMGAQMLAERQLDEIPVRSVIYNLEQMARVPIEQMRPVMRALAQRFLIWDYCEAHLERWRALGCVMPPQYVKLGWAPVLERIAKPARQDIEVLMYAFPGPERLQAFQSLCDVGIRTVFACGLYGDDRDGLIARAKVVVNASLYTTSRVFEIARVCYLLANAKAVVSDLRPDTIIEPDILGGVVAATPQDLVRQCLDLIEDESRRAALEARGRAIARARDIRDILRPVLATLDLSQG
jgi:hypothetical protein